MKPNPPPPPATPATLQTVLDRLAGDGGLSDTPQARPALGGHQLRQAPGPAAGGDPARPCRHPPDPRRHGARPGQGIAQAVGEPAQRPRRRHRGLRPAADAQDRRPRPRCRPGAGFLRLPTSGSAMAFRASPDGRACAGSPQRLSTTARSTASSPNWMRATLIRNLARPAPHRRDGVERPCTSSIRALGCGRLRCRPTGLRQTRIPWQQLPSLVPGGCRAVPHLGVRAGPARRGGAGQGPRAAEPAPAANSHPFGRECGGCGRDPARSDDLVGEPGRTRDLPRPPAPSLAARTDASCPPTPTALPSR